MSYSRTRLREYRQRPEIKEHRKLEQRKHVLAHPEFWMWNRAKVRARRLGLSFTIKQSDIHIPTHCPVLGIRMLRCGPYAPSLDRKNNRRGYTPGNIQVISTRANALKSNASVAEMRKVLRYMESCA